MGVIASLIGRAIRDVDAAARAEVAAQVAALVTAHPAYPHG